MHDASPASPPRRRNTAEEIRTLGAAQSKARTRGLVAVVAGVLSAGGLLGAFLLLSRPPPPVPLPAAGTAEVPVAEVREEPEPGAETKRERTPRSGTKRPRDPIAALARPTASEALRPAGASAPVVRESLVDLEELARSLAAQKKGAVQLCFERELKRDPRLKGSAMVRVTLEAPHRIGSISVQDDLDRHSFTKCVRTAMKSLDFPSLSEDLTVELPFALKSPEF
ncbi:MAG TPA: AgmX/PglI C-terminal domain-containing protein [Myxococcales bacterium]|jgi:hypothetical protein